MQLARCAVIWAFRPPPPSSTLIYNPFWADPYKSCLPLLNLQIPISDDPGNRNLRPNVGRCGRCGVPPWNCAAPYCICNTPKPLKILPSTGLWSLPTYGNQFTVGRVTWWRGICQQVTMDNKVGGKFRAMVSIVSVIVKCCHRRHTDTVHEWCSMQTSDARFSRGCCVTVGSFFGYLRK